MASERATVPVAVDRVMETIEDDVRRVRRQRLLARGGAHAYRDPAIYEAVDRALQRAVEARTDGTLLLLPELLGSDAESDLKTHLDITSHRGSIGSLIVFAKRRILLPLTRWLYEYSLENFRRQQAINRLLYACIEELAIENATLRAQVDEARGTRDNRQQA
jgi:hypothetical protein